MCVKKERAKINQPNIFHASGKKKTRMISFSNFFLTPTRLYFSVFLSFLILHKSKDMTTPTHNKSRRVLIGYDHTEVSNAAMEWIVENRAVFPEDEITLAIIVNDDAIGVEGTFGLESAMAGPAAAFMAEDYRERVSKIEKESSEALKAVVKWFESKGVSSGVGCLVFDKR